MRSDWYTRGDRQAANLGLFVASVGASIPFGLHSLVTYEATAYEIALAALSFVTALGLLVNMLRPSFRRVWPYALATFTWAAHAVYTVEVPGVVVGARFYLGLIFGAWAILAAGTFRVAALHRREATTPMAEVRVET
jgi:hypothetical protein